MEKKKVEQFIIPPTYFKNGGYSITEIPSAKAETPNLKSQIQNTANAEISNDTAQIPNSENGNSNTAAETVSVDIKKGVDDTVTSAVENSISAENQPKKVSAFSLASIRAKKEMEEKNKSYVKPTSVLPTEDFTETEMLVEWNKYAQRLGDKGLKIMESLLLINDPKLNGTVITLELPNEGSKLDFEGQIHGLLGHLKGHLHNHDITIEVIVNEKIETKRSFNDQDRYNRLLEINPNIELLRSTFGLDLLG